MHEVRHSDQTACAVHDLRASRTPTLTDRRTAQSQSADFGDAPRIALHDACMSVGVDPNFEPIGVSAVGGAFGRRRKRRRIGRRDDGAMAQPFFRRMAISRKDGGDLSGGRSSAAECCSCCERDSRHAWPADCRSRRRQGVRRSRMDRVNSPRRPLEDGELSRWRLHRRRRSGACRSQLGMAATGGH